VNVTQTFQNSSMATAAKYSPLCKCFAELLRLELLRLRRHTASFSFAQAEKLQRPEA
jgi:hypothetical protein